MEPVLAWPEDNGPLFHRPSTDAMRRVLTSLRAVTGLGDDAVPPRKLNELPDQGIEALIDLIMLIENKCKWPDVCAIGSSSLRRRREVCDPSGYCLPRVRVQCKLRRIEARNIVGIFWATQARGVERCVWEQAAWSEWATVDGHAVATILRDPVKAFYHVAYQKLVDAAVRTRFPMRQLKLLLPLYRAARHVELDCVAGEALQAQRGIVLRVGCAFATTLLQLMLVGPLGEVRAAHPTVSTRVVVDDLSLQRFGDHNRVTQELERASTCMAPKRMQAGFEIATKRSKVLSNSFSVRARLQAAAAWRAGDADRTKPRNRFFVRDASDHSGATGAAGEVQRPCEAGREIPRQIVGAMAATAGGVAVNGLNVTQLQQSRSQMTSCLAKRMHGKSATMVLMLVRRRARPGV